MSPTTEFIWARATRIGSLRMVMGLRLGHPAVYGASLAAPHRRHQRDRPPRGGGGTGTSGDPRARLPGALVLVAPSAAGTRGRGLPRGGARHARLRGELDS